MPPTVRANTHLYFQRLKAKWPDLVQVGSVQKPTPIVGDSPSDSTLGSDGVVPAPVDFQMIIFEVGPDLIDGTLILVGDYNVIVEPGSVEIDLEDKINCSKGTLTIKRLGRIAPSGVTLLYDMVCEG